MGKAKLGFHHSLTKRERERISLFFLFFPSQVLLPSSASSLQDSNKNLVITHTAHHSLSLHSAFCFTTFASAISFLFPLSELPISSQPGSSSSGKFQFSTSPTISPARLTSECLPNSKIKISFSDTVLLKYIL